MIWQTEQTNEKYISHWCYVVCEKGCIHKPTIYEYPDGNCYYSDASMSMPFRDIMPNVGIRNNLQLADSHLHQKGFTSLQVLVCRHGIT